MIICPSDEVARCLVMFSPILEYFILSVQIQQDYLAAMIA